MVKVSKILKECEAKKQNALFTKWSFNFYLINIFSVKYICILNNFNRRFIIFLIKLFILIFNFHYKTIMRSWCLLPIFYNILNFPLAINLNFPANEWPEEALLLKEIHILSNNLLLFTREYSTRSMCVWWRKMFQNQVGVSDFTRRGDLIEFHIYVFLGDYLLPSPTLHD